MRGLLHKAENSASTAIMGKWVRLFGKDRDCKSRLRLYNRMMQAAIGLFKPLACALACILPMRAAFAAPAGPDVLAPTARWSLNVEPESCALARTFGTGPSQMVLQFEAFRPGDAFTVTIFGTPMEKFTGASPLNLRFLPDGAPTRIVPVYVRRIRVKSNGQPVSAILFYADLAGRSSMRPLPEPPLLPEADLARLNALSVDLGSGAAYKFQLGSMLVPIKALRGCVEAMVRRWGFDPALAAQPQGTPEPLGNPGNWATDNDFPVDALAKGIESDVHYRLTVDPAGQVTACIVQNRFPPGGFGELTCRLLRARAQFRPALDASGKPVASSYASTVLWRIPRH